MKGKPSPQAGRSHGVARLEDIPNVGPAVAAVLRRLGITSPGDLVGRITVIVYDVP